MGLTTVSSDIGLVVGKGIRSSIQVALTGVLPASVVTRVKSDSYAIACCSTVLKILVQLNQNRIGMKLLSNELSFT